jgi:MFS transporter, DHA2 family, multidrug resistance protein
MLVQGFGMGLAMAPATESVMGAIPREHAGVGSAINDTLREIGGALGVAVVGSVAASLYKSHLDSAVRHRQLVLTGRAVYTIHTPSAPRSDSPPGPAHPEHNSPTSLEAPSLTASKSATGPWQACAG